MVIFVMMGFLIYTQICVFKSSHVLQAFIIQCTYFFLKMHIYEIGHAYNINLSNVYIIC